MSGLLVAITISINRGLLLTKKPLNQGFQTIISKYTTQKTDIETGRGLNSGYPGG
jgi:hypothetical protein